jgi:ketosteroid isomerase-like protein
MKKKNGFNIMLFVLISNLFVILSCTNIDKKENQGVLLKTDSEFSAMSEKKGMYAAFLFFVADSGVLLRNNSYPLKGRHKLAELFEKGNDTSFILSWEPLFEKLSVAGDLGYTYGIFSDSVKSTGEIQRGTYVTIWELQDDGSWKFVLDTGTQGLPEKDR